MVVKVKKKKGKAYHEKKGVVTTQAKNGMENEQQIPMGGVVIEGEPTTVMVKLGYTKNLGNYESMRIDVSLAVPCHEDEVDEKFEEIREWVDDKITGIVNEVEQDIE